MKIMNIFLNLLIIMNLLFREMSFKKSIELDVMKLITARRLMVPDLQSITQLLNDKEIIKQVTGGLTYPIPNFEIDAVNTSNLLKYLHSFL